MFNQNWLLNNLETGLLLYQIYEFMRITMGAPQCQFWFFVGLSVAAMYGLLRRKRSRELISTTAIVVLPPAITLPFTLDMFAGHSNFSVELGFIVSVVYIMFGFVGFSLAWIPGLVAGYVFGRAIERPD
jgi:hypothetical protein